LILPCKIKKTSARSLFYSSGRGGEILFTHPSYRPLTTNLFFHELNGLGLRFEKQVSFSGLCPFKKAKPGSKPKIIV
jgi:hypothetical protein